MPKDPRRDPLDDHVENEKQLGNPEPAKAHWPKDLELHPDRKEDDERRRRQPDDRTRH